jgi:HSP20 family molecular chaperone IbpA
VTSPILVSIEHSGVKRTKTNSCQRERPITNQQTLEMSEPLTRVETLPVVADTSQYASPFPGYYTAPSYQTYSIPAQHHLPFEAARKSISHALGMAGHELANPWGEGFRSPHCDIRETPSAYYLDLEIPGLDSKKSVSIKWTSKTTLFVEGVTKRLPLPEDGPVTTVHAGRHVGPYARAFSFPVAVEQDKTSAKLAYGTIRVIVPKKDAQASQHKEVEVEHEGH